MPSRCLLREPYPTNLPVIPVCKACNEGFSLDEEYFAAFLGCVLTGSADPDQQDNLRVQVILRRSPDLRARIEGWRATSQPLFGDTRIAWTPELERVNRVIVKNARGHAFFEYGEPLFDEPEHVRSAPLEFLTSEQRASFESAELGNAWPEVGSRMMTRMTTGQDLRNGWIVIQEGIYRYALSQQRGVLVRTVIHEYLATEVHWPE